MVKIRYGNDIPISWTINRNDKAEDFTLVKSLRLLMTSISSSVEITDYVIDGNVIKWMFWGKDQKAPATYRFTLIENAGQEGMFTIDACNALVLVGTSCAADDCDGPFEVSITSNINDKGVTCTSAITLPSNGLSAYEIAVLHGFKGTEEEWLSSLKGEKGDAFTYDDFTQEEIADLKKPAVDAAKQATAAAEEARTAAIAAGKATTAATDAAGAAIQAATDATEAAEKATEAGTAATEAASNADEAATEATQAATDATEVNQSIQTAEQERVTAEQQRVSAEQTRQTEFSQIKQQAETATNNANTSAAAANEAAENIEQNLSEKQDKTDNSLQTSDKTVVGGINEVNTKAADAPTLALRKLYIAARAVYNEETEYYELNGLTDITEEEMLAIYNVFKDYSIEDSIFRYAYKTNVRTNIVPKINTFTNISNKCNCVSMFYYSSLLEVIRLCDDTELSENFGIYPSVCDNMFAGCLSLKKILGILFGDNMTSTIYMFGRCLALQEVTIKRLKISLSFSSSPLINYESVNYLIANAANTSAITVTVHPTTYSYLTGSAQPTAQVGGTSEQWQAILTAAAGKNISFATESTESTE